MAGWRSYLPMQATWPAAQPLIEDLRKQAGMSADSTFDATARHFLLYQADGIAVAYARLRADTCIDSLCILDERPAADAIMDIGAVMLGFIAAETLKQNNTLTIEAASGWLHLLKCLDPDFQHSDHCVTLRTQCIHEGWRLAGMSEAMLGQTRTHWELLHPQEVRDAIVHMARQAERSLRIFNPTLSHAVFDDAHLADAISALARKSRYTDVRILMVDPRPITQRGHALLNLHRRLSSNVPILKLPHPTDELAETVVIVDDCGVINTAANEEGGLYACFNHRPQARALTGTFDYLWHRGVTDTEIRGLAL